MTDQTEKKVKLAAEDGRSPHPRSLETLGGLVLQYEDELLRNHDELAKRVREFRTDLNSRFKDIAYDVYAAPDRRWIQYILRDLGWHVYIDVKRDEFWGYRFGEEEPACFRHTASLLLEDIERIKEKDDMATDQPEKKVKLATEDSPPPPPPDLDKLDLFLQGGDDLLRDDELGNLVREFREALCARFRDIDSEVYATVDKDWVQYFLPSLGWHVYHDVTWDHYWGYRDKEKQPACFRRSAPLLLEDIGQIKEKDDADAYGVDRAPLWAEIAKTVVTKIGKRNRLRYRLKNDTVDANEENAIVFTLDGKFTFEAHEDGTFSCPGLTNSSLDDVLAHLQDPEKQAIRAKIRHWREEKRKQDQERSAWDAASKAAIGLSKALAALDQPEWGPDTNTRSFYFALNTLYRFAKTKADDPPVSLEQAVVNECLKEMVNLPTPEIVKKLELVSQLVKEEEEQ